MQDLTNSIYEKNREFLNRIKVRKKITIGTLGPEGTSSYNTLLRFKAELLNKKMSTELTIILRDNFSEVYEDLEAGIVDYAMIPSAYERITDFFWNKEFENIFNFLYETPKYGIISRDSVDISNAETLYFASCPAVENMLSLVDIGLKPECKIIKIRTSSTTEAAKFVSEGKADIGVTNITSFEKFTHIKFVSSKYSARIVWSIFGQRMEE